MGMRAWSFDVADLDRQVDRILFGLERSEERVNVLSIVSSQSSLGVLNFEDPEIIVVLVQGLESLSVDLVLELGDSEILDFNWVGDGPLESNWSCREIVDVL
jgi:hypothetical protein